MTAGPLLQHMNVRIDGRVQGVSFRATAHALADALGLTGFIRNEPDGTVYAEVEGAPEKVTQFLSWCRRGPAAAEVRSCEWVEGPPTHFERFTVFRGDGTIANGPVPRV